MTASRTAPRALARWTVGKTVTAAVVAASLFGIGLEVFFKLREAPVGSFRQQACALPAEWLERTKRGYYQPRSGQISLLPKTPAYMASGGDGWSHSGPWSYLQHVPLVFYGPGIVPGGVEVGRPVTTADIAPTMATLVKGASRSGDGRSLQEVARLDARTLVRPPPGLILTIVWDGSGWNTLEQWPDDWPNLARIMREGVSYRDATVGSSPSVTPAVHTTLGTGSYPWKNGITGVPVRGEGGEVVDAFLHGESSRFMQLPAFAERWDVQTDNNALVGMVGYEPWHLGMIGMGAERPGGDKDDAVWLDTETNEWITNPSHYRLPRAVANTKGLEQDLDDLDAADGELDRAWRGHEILDSPDRIEETPAFIRYHARALMNLIEEEGYGDDAVTDLLFTNFKQIDRVGHYFNMASEEVHDSLIETDRQLRELVSFLDEEVGRGRWVLVVTADHGQQPDAAAVGGYGIDPNEVEADIDAEFGPITQAVWPTEAFLDAEAMAQQGVSVAEVARWLGDYRVAENARDLGLLSADGKFGPENRVFAMAIPSALLPSIECAP